LPYLSLSETCAKPKTRPSVFGTITLGSCNSNKPVTLHMKHAATEARVKGRGIALADLVVITVFKDASGLAKRAMHSRTAA